MELAEHLAESTERDWQVLEEGTLRIAAIGLGWWTRDRAIPAIAESSFCETTVVVSGDPDKARRVAEETETVTAALTYDEYQDGEAVGEYDAVYVCTPNARHRSHVAAAAEHGKAVLCEKPLEGSVERAEGLVSDAADVPLMTAYRMQTDPDVRRMRELIRDGAIGDPVAVHGHMTQRAPGLGAGEGRPWRLDPDLVGYGASVMDLGIYPVNTARFVLDAEPVAATATMEADHEDFDLVPDENATFTLTYDDGTTAACTASQNAQLSGAFRVIGTEGELTLEPVFLGQTPQTLRLRRGEEQTATVDAGRRSLMIDQMREEFDYFADRVLREEPIEPDGEEGLHDLKALRAIYEAAETGDRVRVE